MASTRKEEYAKVFTELEAIVNQSSAPLNHNEAEIAGYRDVLNAIHTGYEHLDLRETDILKMHEMMMSLTGYEFGGHYKTDDNVIMEIDADGNRKVRFRPTPAAETSKAMEQLELAYLEARDNANINQHSHYNIKQSNVNFKS